MLIKGIDGHLTTDAISTHDPFNFIPFLPVTIVKVTSLHSSGCNYESNLAQAILIPGQKIANIKCVNN